MNTHFERGMHACMHMYIKMYMVVYLCAVTCTIRCTVMLLTLYRHCSDCALSPWRGGRDGGRDAGQEAERQFTGFSKQHVLWRQHASLSAQVGSTSTLYDCPSPLLLPSPLPFLPPPSLPPPCACTCTCTCMYTASCTIVYKCMV